LLFEQGRFEETFNLINEKPEGLYQLHDLQVATIYLDAAHKLNMDMDKISEEVAGNCPEASILHKIKTLKGNTGEKCEEIVKQKNPEGLLSFYEKENRLIDALSLVRESELFFEEVVFFFYKKHREDFPAETEVYLKNRIEKDLSNTGKKYYERIAESLDLMKRINPARCKRIADEIRANFKRRTSLIQMIRQF
jgi:hypothetical protein